MPEKFGLISLSDSRNTFTIQIVPFHCIKFVVFIVALGIVPQNSIVNSIVFVNYRTIVSLDNPSMTFMITKLFTTHVVEYVQILSTLPIVFAEIRPPKPKKIKSNSCTFSVRRSVRLRRICESAHRTKAFFFSARFRCVCEMALRGGLRILLGEQHADVDHNRCIISVRGVFGFHRVYNKLM